LRQRNRFENEVSALDVREYQVDPQTGTTERIIILAAGVEFPRYGKKPKPITGKRGNWWKLSRGSVLPERNAKTGSHWRQKCLALAAQKLKKNPQLTVFLYDFDRATRELVKLNKSTIETTVNKNFPPLIDANYRWVDSTDPTNVILKPIAKDPLPESTHKERPHLRYCPSVDKLGSGDVKQAEWIAKFHQSDWNDHGLNIRHIYQHIVEIGQTTPYRLQEFHSFGHASSSTYGYLSGTAFVNTTHIGTEADERHPLDLDPRTGLDFRPSIMDFDNFRMAFALGAMSYVWGCNWDVPIFVFIRDLHAKVGKKQLELQTFKLNWKGERKEFLELIKRAGCKAEWKDDKTKTIEITGKCVQTLLRRLLQDTYMQGLANVSAHCATGGVPGTWSDYDHKREKSGEPLLSHIPMAGLYCTPTKDNPCKEDYRHIMDFYLKHIGVAFNRDGADKNFGRGFALYCPEI
jgi:hypothetical protein